MAGEEQQAKASDKTAPEKLVQTPEMTNRRQQETDPPEISENQKKLLDSLRKGTRFPVNRFYYKEGETTPPKRYTSGSLILAMENAGQLIEDEDLRAQIKGSGIGTSATRAEILKKLFTIGYLKLNNKTQVITPEKLGEAVYEVVDLSMKQLLNPDLTASWEKGLTYVAQGSITTDEYMGKLSDFVIRRTQGVKNAARWDILRQKFEAFAGYYR